MEKNIALKSQEHIWLLDNLIKDKQAFNLYYCFLISGEFNNEFLRISIKEVISRFCSLRMYFGYQDGALFSSIIPGTEFVLPFNIVNIKRQYNEEEVNEQISEELNATFDLSTAPLFRVKIFAYLNDVKVLTFVFHKIIIDANSSRFVVKQIFEFYSKLFENSNPKDILIKDHFPDFLYKNKNWLASEEHSKLLKNWYEIFPDPNEKINLPTDFSPQSGINLNGIRERFEINDDIFNNVTIYAQQNQIDIPNLFLIAFAALINRLSNQDSIVIGYPVSLVENMINIVGDADNILPIRFDFSKSPNLIILLNQLSENIAFQDNHEKVAWASLINNSSFKKELSINPFYQASFNFSTFQPLGFKGCVTTEIFISRNGSKLDFSFDLLKEGGRFHLLVEYNTKLIKKDTVSRWVNIYQAILKSLISFPNMSTDEIDILSESDSQQLVDWNDTDKAFANQKCIHAKLEEQVIKNPDAVALRWDEKTLTYDEFNKQVNSLANFIISKGNANNQIIAVCMDRSPEMIICIFSVLKSGGAYLPIDTSAPIERTKLIIEDSNPKIIFTKSGYGKIIPEGNYEIIELDNIIEHPFCEVVTNPSINTSSTNLAYIIYTSGSTGNPKGVMIQHYAVINRLSWMQNEYKINQSDILIQKTPITFDVSVWELFWWSFTGASLVLLTPGAEKEPALLVDAIKKYKVTTIHFVPSMFTAFRMYLDAFKEQSRIESLNTIYLSGEALPAESVNNFYTVMDKYRAPKLVNLYGPTEATVDVSYYNCPRKTDNERIYIGKPIDNTKLLVVNRKNKIQPIGISGELVIAGTNLARGYLNRPELNDEKFKEIIGLDNRRYLKVYKTGDIAKWTDFGEIDYIGRIDNQVKIRGFRIELGEIESKIMEYRDVESCAVIVNKTNPDNPLLIAYIKCIDPQELNINSLKLFLADRLPSYMIPTSFVSLLNMPFTSSGKINRKELPDPQVSQVIEKNVASDEIQRIVLLVWQEVLRNENIDVATNFFDIGGNSIMIPLIVSKLHKEYNLKLNPIDIFQYPTVESLSALINSNSGNFAKKISKTENKTIDDAKIQDKSNIRIAVVGMAGKFPGADTKEEFWEKLFDNKELLSFFSDDILEKHDSTYEKNKNDPNYIKSRGILNNIDMWDAKFFGFSPHDARYTDPQQRLWFETVWNALEDAGCDPYTYRGDISVFAGVNLNSYLFDNILRNRRMYEDYMHFGDAETFHAYVNNDPAFIATRTAYLFNLRGPAINVQSACSTSLMAICQACNSLINHESDIAIAGASSIQTPQEIGYIYQSDGMRSADGHCRPFDANANGTVFSNAIGAVVLKRLDDAIKDNDEIYCTIRGWAINNDGHDKIGFAAPSINGQLELYRKAYAKALISPEEICYIEAHGTGTILGDPIEASGLIQAFREKTSKKQFCGLGSIKGNIGHTDEVAGIMGFIKVALAAYYKKIPATINYSVPNPNIDFEKSPFFVVDKPIEWDPNKPMIMGVSAFGVGGTNAHVVIENFQNEIKNIVPENQKTEIIVVSAKSELSLDNNIVNLVEFYNNNTTISISDLSYTTQLRRAHWQNRAFALVSKDRKLAKKDFNIGSHSKKAKKTVFLFPGQGAQFINMGLALYNSESRFKEVTDYGFSIFKKETGFDLKSILFSDNESNNELLTRTEFTQPALFIVSYALTKLYEQYGIIPDESIGHSIGEYVSACISEVFDFETALRIVIKRGQLMQSVPAGSMMAVRTGFEKLKEINSNIFEIAAINAPLSCTISFKIDMQETVENILINNSIEYVLLKTSHAFHSSQVDIILNEFEKYVNKFILKTPQKPFISCPTGLYAKKEEVTTGKYWANQLRATVQFDKGLMTLQDHAECIFIESGPNTHLSGLTRQNLSTSKETKIIATIGRATNGNTYDYFLESLGFIWMTGLSPNFKLFSLGESPVLVKIPNYAFEKKRYWLDVDYKKLVNSPEAEDYIISEIENKSGNEDTFSGSKSTNYANLTDTEKSLLEIWAQSLGTNDIKVDDNFFDLGGHSLMAISVFSRIKSVFKIELDLRVFFDSPRIMDLAETIDISISKLKVQNSSDENYKTKSKVINGEI